MSEPPKTSPTAKMYCPYCNRSVIRHEKTGDDSDHRWCVVHLYELKMLPVDATPAEHAAAYYALCEAHPKPVSKVRKIKITPAQRKATVPGPYYS